MQSDLRSLLMRDIVSSLHLAKATIRILGQESSISCVPSFTNQDAAFPEMESGE